MIHRRCINCVCYHPIPKGSEGTCKRNPPEPILISLGTGRQVIRWKQPVVKDADSCYSGFVQRSK